MGSEENKPAGTSMPTYTHTIFLTLSHTHMQLQSMAVIAKEENDKQRVAMPSAVCMRYAPV
eukprot:EC785128.1.p4 GENE.EC785128.1~~EC785128.1.p4  ORF type:complete len:61 (-),score=2.83 EC785128.1:175-357(-)